MHDELGGQHVFREDTMFYNAELFQEMKGFARKLMKRDAKRSKAKRLSKKAATRVEPAGDDFSGLQNMEQRVLLSANVFGHSVASHSFENINLVAGDSGVITVLDGVDDGTASLD